MRFGTLFILLAALLGCNTPSSDISVSSKEDQSQTSQISAEEARAIARDAYTYAFPLLDNYRIVHAYFVSKDNTEYKGPWNVLVNIPRVYTPADKAVQTPNSDTPYSMLGFDLRNEPLVLTFPKIEKSRYFSVQLVDAYTHNFEYKGSRTTGNDGGSYLIAGPNWKGELPKGIKKIIRCETELGVAIYRTQLFSPADLENVKKIQAQYKVEPLSTYLNTQPPAQVQSVSFPVPLDVQAQKSSLQAFTQLNYILSFCPTHPSEEDLMNRFARINIGAGKSFDSSSFSPEIQEAMREGIKDAWNGFAEIKTQVDQKKLASGDIFGSRDFLKNNYAYRMAAAVIGIYGNSKEEAMYPVYSVDSAGNSLNGANKYVLRFAPGGLPPVSAFWSITMYNMPASLLVENPINRYLINSPMLPKLKKDKDGGLTIYIQHNSPGSEKESNWLPAPAGPFVVFMRLYWPKPEALSGEWKQPSLILQR